MDGFEQTTITIEDLKQLFEKQPVVKQNKKENSIDLNLDRMRKTMIQKAMTKQKQRTKISQELGISVPTLIKYLKQYRLC